MTSWPAAALDAGAAHPVQVVDVAAVAAVVDSEDGVPEHLVAGVGVVLADVGERLAGDVVGPLAGVLVDGLLLGRRGQVLRGSTRSPRRSRRPTGTSVRGSRRPRSCTRPSRSGRRSRAAADPWPGPAVDWSRVMPGVISAPRRGASARPASSVSASDPMVLTVTVLPVEAPARLAPPRSAASLARGTGRRAPSGALKRGFALDAYCLSTIENLAYSTMRRQYSADEFALPASMPRAEPAAICGTSRPSGREMARRRWANQASTAAASSRTRARGASRTGRPVRRGYRSSRIARRPGVSRASW